MDGIASIVVVFGTGSTGATAEVVSLNLGEMIVGFDNLRIGVNEVELILSGRVELNSGKDGINGFDSIDTVGIGVEISVDTAFGSIVSLDSDIVLFSFMLDVISLSNLGTVVDLEASVDDLTAVLVPITLIFVFTVDLFVDLISDFTAVFVVDFTDVPVFDLIFDLPVSIFDVMVFVIIGLLTTGLTVVIGLGAVDRVSTLAVTADLVLGLSVIFDSLLAVLGRLLISNCILLALTGRLFGLLIGLVVGCEIVDFVVDLVIGIVCFCSIVSVFSIVVVGLPVEIRERTMD
jgi:hypothetical protein